MEILLEHSSIRHSLACTEMYSSIGIDAGVDSRPTLNTSDQMNLTLCLDNDTADQAEPLAPHKNIMDIHNPRKLSGIAAIPKQVVSTIANWLHNDEVEVYTAEQIAFTNSLAMK